MKIQKCSSEDELLSILEKLIERLDSLAFFVAYLCEQKKLSMYDRPCPIQSKVLQYHPSPFSNYKVSINKEHL
jgi:hypothetical protein